LEVLEFDPAAGFDCSEGEMLAMVFKRIQVGKTGGGDYVYAELNNLGQSLIAEHMWREWMKSKVLGL
jgi:hypothetical protein